MISYTDTNLLTLTSQSASQLLNGSYMSQVNYNLPTLVKAEPNVIHRQIALINAQIPVSFYVINNSNNLFRYQLGANPITTITVPNGNYTGSSLLTVLITLVATSGFTATLSNSNGKITFGYTTSFIIYNNFSNSLGDIIGFSQNTVNTSVGNFITPPYALNLLGTKILHIRSTILNTRNFSSIQGGHSTLLSSIPVSAVPFGMIDYHGRDFRISFSNGSLDELDIEIVDGETGEFIDFGGLDWSLTFAIYTTYYVVPTPMGETATMSSGVHIDNVANSIIQRNKTEPKQQKDGDTKQQNSTTPELDFLMNP